MNISKSILVVTGVLLFGTLSARSQEADNGILPFLGLATDARTAGMAGAGSTLGDNSSAVYQNAASALTGEKKAAVGLFAGPLSDDLLIGVSGYCNIGGKNLILAGYRHVGGPDFEIFDDLGNPGGTSHSSDWSADLGYGRLFGKHLAVAVTAHYVHSDLGVDDTASGGAMFGVHVAYKGMIRDAFDDTETGRWSVGLSLRDCGPKFKIGDAKYPLPMRLNLGASVDRRFSRNHALAAALDLDCQLQPKGIFAASLGAEYTFLRHGVVRAGYCLSSAMNNSGNYASLGCGVLVGPVRLDFAYRFGGGEYNPLNKSMNLSAAVRF